MRVTTPPSTSKRRLSQAPDLRAPTLLACLSTRRRACRSEPRAPGKAFRLPWLNCWASHLDAQTVACVPKHSALLLSANLGHLENPPRSPVARPSGSNPPLVCLNTPRRVSCLLISGVWEGPPCRGKVHSPFLMGFGRGSMPKTGGKRQVKRMMPGRPG